MKKLFYILLIPLIAVVVLLAQPGGGPVYVPPQNPGVFIASNSGRGTNTTIVNSLMLTNSGGMPLYRQGDALGIHADGYFFDGAEKFELQVSANTFAIVNQTPATVFSIAQNGVVTVSTLSVTGGDEMFTITNPPSGNPLLMKIGTLTALSIAEDGQATVTVSSNFVGGRDVSVTRYLNVGSYSYTVSTNLTTTGNTPTLAFSAPVPADKAIMINAEVIAKQASSANGGMYHIEAGGSNNGGSTAIISTQTIISEKESIAGTVAITFNNTTDAGEITITGVTATTIGWSLKITVVVSP